MRIVPVSLLGAVAILAFAQTAPAQQVVPASADMAGKSSAFLAAFAGNWRGSGDAKLTPRTAPTRIQCRLSAVFDSVQAVLTNSGKCGTTKGTQDIKGALAAVGDTLTGEFIEGVDTSKLQKQRLRLVEDTLVLEAEMPDDNGGKVHRLRTLLTKPQGGRFVVQNQFYDWATANWVVGGEIAFQQQ